MGDKVTLHGSWACHYTHRVKLALKFKGVTFEFHEECKEHSHKTCPVLVHKKEVISGSHEILEYVEKKWKHHVHRVDFAGYKDSTSLRAKHDHVEKIFEAERRYWYAKNEDKHGIKEEIHDHLSVLEIELQATEYFGGDKIGYVDIVVFSMRHWIQVKSDVTGVDIFTEHKHRKLHEWYHKLHKHEVVRECLPPREKHINLYKDHLKSGCLSTCRY